MYKLLGDSLFEHLYQEYIIFLKTKDDSLIQVSGTNIFFYLNEKFGKQALHDSGIDAMNENNVPLKAKKSAQSNKFNLTSESDVYLLN